LHDGQNRRKARPRSRSASGELSAVTVAVGAGLDIAGDNLRRLAALALQQVCYDGEALPEGLIRWTVPEDLIKSFENEGTLRSIS
jgi:hypothetical protein